MVKQYDGYPDSCSVRVVEFGTISFVVVRGDVDLGSAPLLAAELAAEVDQRPIVVVDLRAVSFFGAAGINVLLEACGPALRRNASIHVIATRRSIVEALQICGVDQAFGVHTTLRDALHVATPVPGTGQLRPPTCTGGAVRAGREWGDSVEGDHA